MPTPGGPPGFGRPKQARAATTAALPAFTLGADEVFTANANVALPALDGVTLAEGDFFLDQSETGGSQPYNWVMQVVDVGQAGVRPFSFIRAPGYPVRNGEYVFIGQGSTLKAKIFEITTPDPITVNTTPLTIEQAGGSGSSSTILTDPTFYVDPVGGNDANAGTISAPFATIDHALKTLSPGWFGLATINVRAGTNTIGNRTVFPSPLGNSNTSAGGIVINGVDSTDSGLGARTANGGTAGSFQAFGTVIDSVGGLTVNQWRGSFLRFTSGATLNGRSFLIAENSATTFTICGIIAVAPTTETFVIETPAAIVSWSGTQGMQGSCPVGVQNLAFSGGGGSNAFRWSGFVLGQQRCAFANMGSSGLAPRNGAGLTDMNALLSYLGATTLVQQCGSYFNGTPISLQLGSASGLEPISTNLNRCLFKNSSTEQLAGGTLQYVSCYFLGDSWVRSLYGTTALVAASRFNAVTPAPVTTAATSALGAALVFSRGSTGVVSNCDISNTPNTTAPGDGIFLEDGSRVDVPTTTGTGNAGFGCRVNRLSQVRKSLGTTITGALGDLSLGALGLTAWGATAVLVTDPTELCLAGPNI